MDEPRHALVIEDDADSRVLFVEMLTDCGMESVAVAHHELPGAREFTVVVTDLPRPRARYSSAAAVAWVNQLAWAYRAPVVVVTGNTEAAHDTRLREVAAHVIQKPLDMDEFIDRVTAAAAAPR